MSEKTERKRVALHAMQAMAAPLHLAAARGWQLGSQYLPARVDEEVGGDFFDFFPIDRNLERYGVLVGDVMGKGKEAAAHTALLRYTVRAYACEGHQPADILERLNTMVEADPVAQTASLFFGILDGSTGALRYASAGHEPPILFRAAGGYESLAPTGPLVGVGFGVRLEQSDVIVEPGDKLLMITDGVSEARDRSGRFLEEEGFVELFHRCAGVDPQSVVDEFTQLVVRYAEGDNRDDIAVLLLSRDPATLVPLASKERSTEAVAR